MKKVIRGKMKEIISYFKCSFWKFFVSFQQCSSVESRVYFEHGYAVDGWHFWKVGGWSKVG